MKVSELRSVVVDGKIKCEEERKEGGREMGNEGWGVGEIGE